MPALTPQQIAKVVYEYIGVEGGYLGDFSYATHERFYPLYCDLDVNPYNYDDTTRERFMTIIGGLPPHDQAKVLRGVLERFPIGAPGPASRTESLRNELLRIASALEGVQIPDGVGAARASVTPAIADAEVLAIERSGQRHRSRAHRAARLPNRRMCEGGDQIIRPIPR